MKEEPLAPLLMSFAALLTAVGALIVSVWQQYRIDRAERWAREAKKEVSATNGKLPPA